MGTKSFNLKEKYFIETQSWLKLQAIHNKFPITHSITSKSKLNNDSSKRKTDSPA